MELGGLSYLAIFVATVLLVWVLTPLALKVAVTNGLLDHPGEVKPQDAPQPYLGGMAMLVAFSAAILIASLINPPSDGLRELGVVLGLGLGLSLMGLIDDIRGLNHWLRLALEVGAALALLSIDVRVELFGWAPADALLTVLWIVGITNAFNLLDNMDGLSAGIAAISAFFFFLIAAINGQFLVAGLSVALLGCALGFLRHNFHPAKIYMGDAGSLYLGFLLAVIGLKLRFDSPKQITFMVPILVLGVAIFDTALVTLTRIINHRTPWSGGRDHMSHRLVFVGLSVPVSVALIYAAQVALGWLALVMSRVDTVSGYLLMGFVVATALFFGVLLSLVPVHEHSTRRRMMIQEVKAHESEVRATEAEAASSAGS
jgi:UDP-GlcNAc:undecaprenyl-phosphate/decaprenyl-phosphate GlcNAc-1-phosphate transferase